ncbi:MAG: SRPBCC domain-containing protein [Anaerolineales bacterium]|nr:SRPBCC domain-containing protein [Anaerolineales bacterium]
MAANKTSLRFKVFVGAPPGEVYRAFTHATALRDWLANAAQSEARVGGRLYLFWSSGYTSTGEYRRLEPGARVEFGWLGAGEPEPSQVQVKLKPKGGGTSVQLTHSRLGSGKKWAASLAQIQRGWEVSLENLKSVLETGNDMRVARRPRLGIFLDELTAAAAARLGAPVSDGALLAGVAEGAGAQAAGLQKGDVIVRMDGKKITRDLESLSAVLARHKAGDEVPVVFYRGAEKHSVSMTLSARPTPPELPASGAELAERARQNYAAFMGDLRQRLTGVSEAEAEHAPAPQEWNLKQLTAHFIACERDLQAWIADMLNDNTVGDSLEFRPNVTARLDAMVARFGSLPALVDELQAAADETTALLAALPPSFVARKPMFGRVAAWITSVGPSHLPDEHGDQLTATLAAARERPAAAQRGEN